MKNLKLHQERILWTLLYKSIQISGIILVRNKDKLNVDPEKTENDVETYLSEFIANSDYIYKNTMQR